VAKFLEGKNICLIKLFKISEQERAYIPHNFVSDEIGQLNIPVGVHQAVLDAQHPVIAQRGGV
jgi:hypothetical protein